MTPNGLEYGVGVAQRLGQAVRALIVLLKFEPLQTLVDEDGRRVLEQNRKFAPVTLPSMRHAGSSVERGIEMSDRFRIGGAGDGALAGELAVVARRIGKLRPAEMIRQDFRFRRGERGKTLLENAGDAS